MTTMTDAEIDDLDAMSLSLFVARDIGVRTGFPRYAVDIREIAPLLLSISGVVMLSMPNGVSIMWNGPRGSIYVVGDKDDLAPLMCRAYLNIKAMGAADDQGQG